jgi:phage tail sheath protein FI
MDTYSTPGVYVREIATLPPSVAEVSTAIPAFLGYTETAPAGGIARVSNLLEFQSLFGAAAPSQFLVKAALVEATGEVGLTVEPQPAGKPNPAFLLYYCLSHYFLNGGGPCWIISTGTYGATPNKDHFIAALGKLETEDEPTLILFPDATMLETVDFHTVAQAALAQCFKLKDRFTILDVPGDNADAFRNGIGMNNLSYGAAYYPYLQTALTPTYAETGVTVESSTGTSTFRRAFNGGGGASNGITVSFTGPDGSTPSVRIDAGTAAGQLSFAIAGAALTIGNADSKTGTQIATAWTAWQAANPPGGFALVVAGTGAGTVAATAPAGTPLPRVGGATATLADLAKTQTALYARVRDALAKQRVTLPPSAAMAGIFASVDRSRGVWKAPANVSVAGVIGPTKKVTDEDQDGLNVDVTAGKSINCLRTFAGKGTLVWGARTLAGNDNEWRYVPVRRLFITVEENTKKASAFAVFEPNEATTWLKVKGMIESYLYGLWERGALAGSKPEQAYIVSVGLGRTMTPQDVLEGRLIVEMRLAAVRPAEFIVLRFMHKLQEA